MFRAEPTSRLEVGAMGGPGPHISPSMEAGSGFKPAGSLEAGASRYAQSEASK